MVYHEGGLPQWSVTFSFLTVFIPCNTTIPAAMVMYQRARKFAVLAAEPSDFVPMAELQMEAYLGASNALSLVDQKVAWIAIPLAAESEYNVCRCHPRFYRANCVLVASETTEVIEVYSRRTVCPREERHGSSHRKRHPLRLHDSVSPIGAKQG